MQLLIQIGNIYPCRRFQIQLALGRQFPLLRCHGGKEIVHGNRMRFHTPAIQKPFQQKCRSGLSRTRGTCQQDHRTLCRSLPDRFCHLLQFAQKCLICLLQGVLGGCHFLIDVCEFSIFHGRFHLYSVFPSQHSAQKRHNADMLIIALSTNFVNQKAFLIHLREICRKAGHVFRIICFENKPNCPKTETKISGQSVAFML